MTTTKINELEKLNLDLNKIKLKTFKSKFEKRKELNKLEIQVRKLLQRVKQEQKKEYARMEDLSL